MAELRKLFALLLASERKYVDPTKAVELLRKGFSDSSGANGVVGIEDGGSQQEDVSEFTHILFAWMEEAFNGMKKEEEEDPSSSSKKEESMEVAAAGAVDSERDKSDDVDNPMSSLFYGRIQVEGKMQGGENFCRSETFTQHTLQVNTFSDIHESLEDSTAEENLENLSCQERWFTQLPPVLFFSLSRFQFNVDKRIAEKIHNRLDFPELLFMDRYMSENKEVTREKRREVMALKGRREELQAKLKTFTDFGGEKHQMPLPLILQYAMEFATSSSSSADISMSSPHSVEVATASSTLPASSAALNPNPNPTVPSLMMQVDSPCHSPRSMTPATSLTCLTAAGSGMQQEQQQPSRDLGPGGDNAVASTKEEFAPMDVEMVNEPDELMGGKSAETELSEVASGPSESMQQQQQQQQCGQPVQHQQHQQEQSKAPQRPCPKHASEMEMRVIQVINI